MSKIELRKLSSEYLKSYYSINSYIGCTINCGYCFLAPIKIVPMKPNKVIEEEQLIEEMLNDKYFKKDQTVISINNRTDPFISEEVKLSTFKLLDIMEEKGLHNIVTMTTKGLLTIFDGERLNKYKNIRIVIIVTYNGIPKEIQPINQSIQEATMKNISKYKNIKLLHQFRPIIPNVNDSKDIIRRIVSFAKQYCDATIYQGIRVNEYIKDRLQERNYNYEGDFDVHKQKSQQTDCIFEKIKRQNPSYPIFEHTSCCLSYIFDMADYNLHFKKIKCSSDCKNYINCRFWKYNEHNNLDYELKRIGVLDNWYVDDDILYIDGSLNDEQKSFIKHILHLQVKSKLRENTYSEKIMEGKYESKNSI